MAQVNGVDVDYDMDFNKSQAKEWAKIEQELIDMSRREQTCYCRTCCHADWVKGRDISDLSYYKKYSVRIDDKKMFDYKDKNKVDTILITFNCERCNGHMGLDIPILDYIQPKEKKK
jgi:hypothetical protein